MTIKKADGTIKIVSMIRDEVVLDETYAKSAVINEGGKRLDTYFSQSFMQIGKDPTVLNVLRMWPRKSSN